MPAPSGLLGHLRHGSGPETVVVLHEWMGDHRNYQPMLPYLSPAACSWVFADLRGYGLSRAIAGAFTLDEAIGDVTRLMDGLGVGRFHVVGHSMTGMLAPALARRLGDRVAGVVAIAPVPVSGFRADAAALAGMTALIDDDDALRAAIDLRTAGRYGGGWIEAKLAMTRAATTRAAMAGYLRMFTGTDVSAEVAGLATPVTVILGAHDLPCYREEAIRPLFAPWYPRLEIAVSREAGHYPMLETPVLLAALIERAVLTPG